jgi:L-lactate utilization protein LutB
MEAGAGMTGCNFGVAATGDCVVCTNEGNADMTTSMPKLHIVAMGIEKLVPDYKSLAVFQRLLCRCGTGQPTTTFTSHFRQARPGAEMHVVLVDNGRSDILADKDHWQTLKCMRCGACMNTCPVYRRSGGYSYTYFIPGPIGVNLGMLKNPQKYSDNVSACTLCLSCDNVCPSKVGPGSQIYVWRQSLEKLGKANPVKKAHQNGVTVVRDASLSEFWEVLNENLEKRFGAKPVHTLQEMELLKSRFPENIIQYNAYRNGHIIGGLTFYITQQVVHGQYSSTNDEGKEFGAMEAIYEQIMYHDYPDYPYLDFGSSTEQQGAWINEGLIAHKEGYGGRGVVYDTYEWTV